MGDGTMLLLGLIIGLLCAALVSAKAVEDALHTGYQDGLRDGAEEARIMWENQMKEDALFAKNAEDVSGND